jgi:hypothetical protein
MANASKVWAELTADAQLFLDDLKPPFNFCDSAALTAVLLAMHNGR